MLPMPPAESRRPKTYLFNWSEILEVLELENDKKGAARRLVRRLLKRYGGPILFPMGRGGQPHVDKAELLDWWDGLRDRWEELQDRRRDRKATAEESHPYGRSGVVAPGVAGSVRPRRLAS